MGAWIGAVTREVKQDMNLLWLWRIMAWPVGVFLYLQLWLIRATSKIEVVAPSKFSGSAVYVNWHRHLPFLVSHNGEYRRWLMVSAAPYMEPIALWCELSGLKLVRGASGQGGRLALSGLQQALQSGEPVMLAVDGPAGPGFKVKKGCIDLAQETGCPIIPVSYSCARGKTVRGRWDRMLKPSLFDHIQIRYGTPIYLEKTQSLESASQEIEIALNELDPALSSGEFLKFL